MYDYGLFNLQANSLVVLLYHLKKTYHVAFDWLSAVKLIFAGKIHLLLTFFFFFQKTQQFM